MGWNKHTTHIPADCRANLNVDETGSAITINVGEDLDLRLRDTFLQAVAWAQRSVARRIIVDLGKTRRIFDSGLAMLMLLNDRSWRLSSRVRIINCRPELKHRLVHGLIPARFNLVQDCQDCQE